MLLNCFPLSRRQTCINKREAEADNATYSSMTVKTDLKRMMEVSTSKEQKHEEAMQPPNGLDLQSAAATRMNELMQRNLAVAAAASVAASVAAAQRSRLSFSVDSLLGTKTAVGLKEEVEEDEEEDEAYGEEVEYEDGDEQDDPEDLSVDVDDVDDDHMDDVDRKSTPEHNNSTKDSPTNPITGSNRNNKLVMPTPLNAAALSALRLPVSMSDAAAIPSSAAAAAALNAAAASQQPPPPFLAGIMAMAAAANGGNGGAIPHSLFPPISSAATSPLSSSGSGMPPGAPPVFPNLPPPGSPHGIPLPSGLAGLHHHLFKAGGEIDS